ncbi:hypothetical protein ACOMOC_001598 [Enterococcus faecalis]
MTDFNNLHNLSSNNSNNSDNSNKNNDLMKKVKLFTKQSFNYISDKATMIYQLTKPFLQLFFSNIFDFFKTKSIAKLDKKGVYTPDKSKLIRIILQQSTKHNEDIYNQLIKDAEAKKEEKKANKLAKKQAKKQMSWQEKKENLSVNILLILIVVAILIVAFSFLKHYLSLIAFIALFIVAPIFYKIKHFVKEAENEESLKELKKIRADVYDIYMLFANTSSQYELQNLILNYLKKTKEIEETLNIKLDCTKAGITKDLNEIVKITIKADTNDKSKITVNKSTDDRLNLSIIPSENKLVSNYQIELHLDNFIAESLNLQPVFDVKQYILDNDFAKYYSDLADLELKNKGLSKEALKYINFLRQDNTKEVLGMHLHNQFAKKMVVTKKYLKVFMVLDSITKSQIQSKASYIGSKLGITPYILKGDGDNSCYLMFVFDNNFKGRAIKYNEIREMAEKRELTIGATLTEDLVVKYPDAHNPKNLNDEIGGLAGSGKTSFINLKTAFEMELKDEDGNYEYQDFAFLSVKANEDFRKPFAKTGALIVKEPQEQYDYLCLIDDYFEYEVGKQITDVYAKDIADYNKTIANNSKYSHLPKLGIFNLKIDEKQNNVADLEYIKIKNEFGETVNLKQAYEIKLAKMARTHRSRGLRILVGTQDFNVKEMGAYRKQTTTQIYGVSSSNVWNNIDKSGFMFNHITNNNKQNMGQFYFKSSELKVKNEDNFLYLSDERFIEVATNYIDSDEIAKNISRKFNTKDKLEAFRQKRDSVNNQEESTIQSINETISDDEVLDFDNLDL